MTDEKDKKIDQTWKDAVDKEKAAPEGSDNSQPPLPEANLATLLSGLLMEGMITLGELENPITKKKEAHLGQAKYVIDTLTMIKEKTKGNLNAQEANMLDGVLYELRMKYVAKNK